MGARKLYEEQIMKLVQEAPEEKLPSILARLKSEAAESSKRAKTKEEIKQAIEKAQGIFKGSLSSVEEFMKWKQEERALEREQEERRMAEW
jgi:hypothetical protein